MDNFLDNQFRLPEPARTAFMAAWKPMAFAKGQFLVPEGRVCHHIYFLSKGAVRIFYHKDDKEVTEWLALDNSFFFSIRSFFEQIPTHLIIQALEPSELYGISHDDFMRLCEQYHPVEKVLREMVTRSLLLSQARMESIQFETAQQRYNRLIQDRPDMLQRIPLAYIASFLGITQETLSRIRGEKVRR